MATSRLSKRRQSRTNVSSDFLHLHLRCRSNAQPSVNTQLTGSLRGGDQGLGRTNVPRHASQGPSTLSFIEESEGLLHRQHGISRRASLGCQVSGRGARCWRGNFHYLAATASRGLNWQTADCRLQMQTTRLEERENGDPGSLEG